MFVGKARRLSLDWSPVRCSALLSSSLALKYWSRGKVNDVANALAYYDTPKNPAVKRFILQAPGVNIIKLFSP